MAGNSNFAFTSGNYRAGPFYAVLPYGEDGAAERVPFRAGVEETRDSLNICLAVEPGDSASVYAAGLAGLDDVKAALRQLKERIPPEMAAGREIALYFYGPRPGAARDFMSYVENPDGMGGALYRLDPDARRRKIIDTADAPADSFAGRPELFPELPKGPAPEPQPARERRGFWRGLRRDR